MIQSPFFATLMEHKKNEKKIVPVFFSGLQTKNTAYTLYCNCEHVSPSFLSLNIYYLICQTTYTYVYNTTVAKRILLLHLK